MSVQAPRRAAPRLPSQQAPDPRANAIDVARRRYDLLVQSILTGRGISKDGRSLGDDAHPPGVIFDDQLAELRQLCATLGIEPPQTRRHDWQDWNEVFTSGRSYRRPSGLSGLV